MPTFVLHFAKNFRAPKYLEGCCFGSEDKWQIKNIQMLNEIFRFSNHDKGKPIYFEIIYIKYVT